MLANKIFMIQMTVPPGFVEKRKFPALRELVNKSSGTCEMLLKWGAKHLKVEDKAGLDSVIKNRLPVDQNSEAIEKRPHIKSVYDAVLSSIAKPAPDQDAAILTDLRTAMLWMSHKLDSDQFDTLDVLVELDSRPKKGRMPRHHQPQDGHQTP